jgi:hypothetical protein
LPFRWLRPSLPGELTTNQLFIRLIDIWIRGMFPGLFRAMPYNSTQPRRARIAKDIPSILAAIAAQAVVRFPRRFSDQLKLEATAAAFNWIFSGPCSVGGTPRYADWTPERAIDLLMRATKIERGQMKVAAPKSLRSHVRAFCEHALRRAAKLAPPKLPFAEHVARVDARLLRVRKFCVRLSFARRTDTFANALSLFTDQVDSRIPDRPRGAVRRAVGDTVTAWVMHGPARADGTPRFCRWDAERAAFALTRLRRLRPRLRRRSFTLASGSTVMIFERRTYHAPRSLWLAALERCQRIEPKAPAPAVVSLPEPVAVPVPVVTLSAWDKLANAFAQHAADARARLTATWGNARHRAALTAAAVSAVHAWVRTGAHKLARIGAASDLPAALARRMERAKAASVHVFTFWPASLLRAVRRALDLVTVAPVALRQVVEVAV